MQLDYHVSELDRIVNNMVQIGKIVELDLENARVKVAIGDLVTPGLPWLLQRAGKNIEWWVPEEDEQVLILSPGGNISQGIIMGSLYQEKFPLPDNKASIVKKVFEDGTSISYDRDAHQFELSLKETPDGDPLVTFKADTKNKVMLESKVPVEIKTDAEVIVTAKKIIIKGIGGDDDVDGTVDVAISASGNVSVVAGGDAVVNSKGKVTLTATAEVNIKAAEINLAAASVNIK